MNYPQAVARLEPLRDSRDINTLEKTVNEIEQDLRQAGGEDYSRFMLYVCNLLSSFDFREYQRQTQLVKQYADAALANAPFLALQTELQLLAHLEEDFGGPGGTKTEWTSKRRSRAARWMTALQRLENETQADFNFNDLPQINIEPPPGTNLPAGIAPEAIQDPALRKEYETAIQKNQQKADTFARQFQLRELRNRYRPLGVRYIARAYSRPPFDEAELQQLLNEHFSDEGNKAAILNTVRQGIAKGSE